MYAMISLIGSLPPNRVRSQVPADASVPDIFILQGRQQPKKTALEARQSLGRKRPRRAFTVYDCTRNLLLHRTIVKAFVIDFFACAKGLADPDQASCIFAPGRRRQETASAPAASVGLDPFTEFLMLPDFAFFDALAEAAAAETLPRFRMSVAVDNKEDAGFDPVTEADREAERAIRTLISERFPDHGILGEEHGDIGLDRDYVWVIDPIDGTRAFISGLPVWGTLVGLYHKHKAVMGMMDQPFTGERFIAEPGNAMVQRNGKVDRIRSRSGVDLDQAILMTTSPFIFPDDLKPAYQRIEQSVRLARYGCDCYAYAMVACGAHRSGG
jgi:myo-inositol-1(or 4)-monophosphatase